MSLTGINPDGSLRERVDQLGRQAQLASGLSSTSSPAGTGKLGVLNPAFVCWLMGYPEEWHSSGVTAMRLFRKKRRIGSTSAGKSVSASKEKA